MADRSPPVFDDEMLLQRLSRAMQWSSQRMQPFRQEELAGWQQYVGAHYSDENPPPDFVPINVINQAVNTHLQRLAARNPKAMVTSNNPDYLPGAARLERDVNFQIKQMDLASALQECVRNSMFSVGVCKVGWGLNETVDIGKYRHNVGVCYAESLDLDDCIIDMSAKRFDELDYVANRYTVPLEWARETDLFDKKAREELSAPSSIGAFNEGGDERKQTMTQGHAATWGDSQYIDKIDLWDIWLPFRNIIITVPNAQSGILEIFSTRRALRTVEWDGPGKGPFHFLFYDSVPQNLMPSAPIHQWYDVHDLINRLFLKLGRQAERQKSSLAVQAAASEDGKRAVDVSDGEAFRVDHPPAQALEEVHLGGIHSGNFAFMLQCYQIFSKLAGNLESMAGLSPQADTVGQEKLIARSNSVSLDAKADRVLAFTTGIVRDIAWYRWNDPLAYSNNIVEVPGMPYIQLRDEYHPGRREGEFFDYIFDIHPHSMAPATPAAKLQSIMGLVNGIIVPLYSIMQTEGIAVDVGELIKVVSDLSDIGPSAERIVKFVGPPDPEENPRGGQHERSMSPNTTRTNERISRTDPEAKTNQLIQALMSAGNNGQSLMKRAGAA